MAAKVVVAYASRYGSTQEVAEAIAAELVGRGLDLDVLRAKEVRRLDGYDGVVLGAPLVMHHWHKDAVRFLWRHRDALLQLPVAVFALGPVKEPREEQEWQDSRAQLDDELAKTAWFEPVAVEILGGKFDPSLLRFPLNKLAGSAAASDIRDWEAVRAWAGELAALFAQSAD
jgi:menaquinone-dependent protoporphyrinogen oxidase